MNDTKNKALMEVAKRANRLAVKYDRKMQMTHEDWSDLQEALFELKTAFENEAETEKPTVGFRPR